jgi:hypothetical protein
MFPSFFKDISCERDSDTERCRHCNRTFDNLEMAEWNVCKAREIFLGNLKCECGARAIGVKNFNAGHSDWCPVRNNWRNDD